MRPATLFQNTTRKLPRDTERSTACTTKGICCSWRAEPLRESSPAPQQPHTCGPEFFVRSGPREDAPGSPHGFPAATLHPRPAALPTLRCLKAKAAAAAPWGAFISPAKPSQAKPSQALPPPRSLASSIQDNSAAPGPAEFGAPTQTFPAAPGTREGHKRPRRATGSVSRPRCPRRAPHTHMPRCSRGSAARAQPSSTESSAGPAPMAPPGFGGWSEG